MWPLSIIWLIAFVVFLAAEAVTVGLVSIWFAAGALCALLTSLAVDNFWVQMAVFLAVSAAALCALRPLTRKYFGSRDHTATNADRVIGARAVVTEEIDNLEGRGMVTVNGARWTARSADGTVIPKDTRVTILRIEGVKVFVRPADSAAAGEKEAVGEL